MVCVGAILTQNMSGSWPHLQAGGGTTGTDPTSHDTPVDPAQGGGWTQYLRGDWVEPLAIRNCHHSRSGCRGIHETWWVVGGGVDSPSRTTLFVPKSILVRSVPGGGGVSGNPQSATLFLLVLCTHILAFLTTI